MLKRLLTLFVVWAVACGAPQLESGQPTQPNILQFIPIKELKEVAHNHYRNDRGFQAAVKYFKTPEWEGLIQKLREAPTWKEYKEYLTSVGIDIGQLIDHLTHCLKEIGKTEIPDVGDAKPDLTSFLTDAKLAVIKPLHEVVLKLAGELKQGDSVYGKLYASASSAKHRELLEKSTSLPEMQAIVEKLQGMGVDVKGDLKFLYLIFDWK